MNEMTKPWGLEVDRVELMLEGVLRDPDGGQSGPLIMPPSVPGLEGLTGPIQQLAMHFLSQTAACHTSKGDIYNLPHIYKWLNSTVQIVTLTLTL